MAYILCRIGLKPLKNIQLRNIMEILDFLLDTKTDLGILLKVDCNVKIEILELYLILFSNALANAMRRLIG